MFYISASERDLEITVRDLAACSLTTVSSTLARFSRIGRNNVLSGINSLWKVKKWALPNFTKLFCDSEKGFIVFSVDEG